MSLKAPFPWFGGKSLVTDIVWPRFGDVPNYIEPFAGSLAMLLNRPHWNADQGAWQTSKHNRMECVNDLDGCITNFWRAVKHDPEAVAEWADNPVHELDLHARHLWLHRTLLSADGLDAAARAYATDKGVLPFGARLTTHPEYYDAQVAGWWVWGMSSWIGDNFCRPSVQMSLPHLRGAGQGVNRQLPHLGREQGVCARRRAVLCAWFQSLADRLRNVGVCCGDWERICGNAPTTRGTPCGVFLDPPYSQDHGLDTVYGEYHDNSMSTCVREWCVAHEANPELRIALCGYDTEHAELTTRGWECVAWKARGGYSNKSGVENVNAGRERIWFSPHVLQEADLFNHASNAIPEEEGVTK